MNKDKKNDKVSMEEFVYNKLKNAIYKRYIRPNSKLVETAIAEQLGVSRTPVRAAIKKLVYDGFVQLKTNKGAYVIKPTIREIKDTFAVRTHLEEMSSYLAAKNIKEYQIHNLRELLEEEKKISKIKDLGEYYQFNDKFHLEIAKASGNKLLLQYVSDVISKTNIYLILFDPFYQMGINPSIKEHLDIILALEKRNQKEAKEAMRIHLKSALEGMKLEEIEENIPKDYLFI